ncbi:MAG TPA: hypothetical protein DCQ58_04470 [Saprospirales bacterium]|nr:hypothetical protein [Saprospirales bacterium]
MFTFTKAPFVWLLIIYVSGILTSTLLSGQAIFVILIFLLTGSLLMIMWSFLYDYKRFYLIIIPLLLIFSVIRYHQFHDHSLHQLAVGKFYLENIYLEFNILEAQGDKFFSRRIARIIRTEPGYEMLTGKKILLNFKRDTTKSELRYLPGETYRTHCNISPVPNNGNPSAFNFKKFMHAQNIHLQAYPDTSGLEYIGMESSLSPFRYFASIRNHLTKWIEVKLPHQRSSALVAALTLGEKGGLDASTLDVFSKTGARHILTVSGMHVGIIMLILLFITAPLKRSSLLFRLIRNTILFSGLWSYVFLIGAQPAVLRAGFMLSIYILAREFYRNQNSLNTLSFSAFVLLFFNPLMLFQLSFIFTYLALFSILCYYKPIFSLWTPGNKVLNYFWQLTSMSIAAQVLMMPISLYFFHIAPIYFMVSGLIATPAALAIFVLTLLFFVEQLIFKGTTTLFAYLLDLISGLFLDSMALIDGLPYSSLQNIWITETALFLFIMVILSFSLAFLHQKKNYLYIGFGIAMILAGYHYWHQRSLEKHEELCIYSDKNDLSIDLFVNKICYSIQSDTLSQKTGDYTSKNHRMKHGIKRITNLRITENYADQYIQYSNGILYFKGCQIYIYSLADVRKIPDDKQQDIDKFQDLVKGNERILRLPKNETNHRMSFLIYTCKNQKCDEVLLSNFPGIIIFPAHLPFWELKSVKKILPDENIWDIRDKGAFRIIWD